MDEQIDKFLRAIQHDPAALTAIRRVLRHLARAKGFQGLVDTTRWGMRLDAAAVLRPLLRHGLLVSVNWGARLLSPWGDIKWVAQWHNIIVDAGVNYALDVGLSGGAAITTWYIGLINGATPTIAPEDTMASHVGWTENANYDEATREAWVDAGVTGGSADNSGSVASFAINTNAQTLGGAFLTSNSTKGGTTGTLYAAGTFATSKSADDGDTLEVTATFTAADDGV